VHVQAYDFVARHRPTTGGARVLEIGSLDINGSVRPLFTTAGEYHGIDMAEGPGVDEVADASEWRKPEAFDVVVSTEVLEHAERWREILDNAWESLAPGGRMIITCATHPRPPHSAVDGWDVREGEWYRNVPSGEVLTQVRTWGARRWCIEVASDRGDLYLSVDRP
jgi:SAM-dependent methyltransferase